MTNLRDDELWEELYNQILNSQKQAQGQSTGGAAPIEIQEHWDKNGKIYQTDINGNRLPSTSNHLEKITNKAKAMGTNFSNWINETNPEHKSYKEKMNLIGALSTIPLGAGTIVAKTATSKLAPYVGRKIAQGIGDGISGGAIGGAVEGALRSYQEKKNPVQTIPQDAAAGALMGTGLGAVGGNIQKAVRGNQLKNIEDIKELRKAETSFYKDYLQQKIGEHPRLGKINFTQSGLETVSKQPQAARNFPTLHKDLKKADYIGFEEPIHKKHGTRDNIKGFHKLKNNSQEFLIAETDDGLKYYMSKDIGKLDNRPSRVESNLPSCIIPEKPLYLNSFEDWLREVRCRRGH